jgi:putative membrane protein
MADSRELLPKSATEAIERAVSDAEARTSAEIVVAISARSGRYQRAADFFGLALSLAAVAAAWSIWQAVAPSSQEWSTGSEPVLGLPLVLILVALWFVIGAGVASRWPILARPFMTRAEREAAVRRRGFEAFHTLRVAGTRGRTGLLIFVSLFERTVWVCPDEAIASTLGPQAWKPLSDLIAEGFRARDPGPAMARAVTKAGEMLAKDFPRQPGDDNELGDRVHIVSPERRA